MERNWLDIVALILIIIGAINWGLIGFFRFDLDCQSFRTIISNQQDYLCHRRHSRNILTHTFLEIENRIILLIISIT